MKKALSLVAALSFVGLTACDGNARREGPSASGSGGPVATITPADAAAPVGTRVSEGAAAYAKYCALCHGPDAAGYAADNAPSLVTSTFLASASDEFLTRSIREGRPGTAMAAYAKDRGGPLDDGTTASLIAFLRSHGPPAPLPAYVSGGDAARGKAIYETHCALCHGTPQKRGEAPFLANPVFLAAANDAFVRYAIVNGRPGTPMRPFGASLDPMAVDDVVASIRAWATPPPALPAPAPPPVVPLEGPLVLNPRGKPPPFAPRDGRFVPADDVKKALDAKRKLIVIDARASSEWLSMRIPGSISVPYYQLDRLAKVPNDGTWVVAYCACPHHASGVVVDELRRLGFAHAAVLDEGILVWNERGYPVIGSAVAAKSSESSAPSPRRP